MKRTFPLIGFLLILTLVLGACDSKKSDTLKSSMVTNEGGINDKSFNESVWKGLNDASRDFDIEVDFRESKDQSDYRPNLTELLDEENELIWAAGYKMGQAIYDAANANKNTKYAIIDYSYENNPEYPVGTPENLLGVTFNDEESSFLVGYIAGRMTKSDKVGFVGGTGGEVIWRFEYGYRAGVEYAANELNKKITVTDNYADDFYDVNKAKGIARGLYEAGNDIIFHAAGGAGEGVIQAAVEMDKWVIGVDMDQNHLAPDNVLTSAMKGVDRAVYNVLKDLKEGKFSGGMTIQYGLKDGGVDIAPTSDKNIPSDILRDVEIIKEKIISEEIDVPYNLETFKLYTSKIK